MLHEISSQNESGQVSWDFGRVFSVRSVLQYVRVGKGLPRSQMACHGSSEAFLAGSFMQHPG